ncbi:MAG: hypothetical protein GXN92_03080 [Candidatus Micrarchaeota archaeon]|nr:hypothetical protein [Candidatus Micrarchaeota archaeon]
MIELDDDIADIEEKRENIIKSKRKSRPEVLEAKVYQLNSAFVNYPVFITISYIKEEDGSLRPFEIFINSKDLAKSAEYTVLSRLISEIFRRSEDPTFIIEELRSIHDPNGGAFKDGRYIASLYGEIADILETFFYEIGLVKNKPKPAQKVLFAFAAPNNGKKVQGGNGDAHLKICPACNQRTLKVENGCTTCINPDCGYSKCE